MEMYLDLHKSMLKFRMYYILLLLEYNVNDFDVTIPKSLFSTDNKYE